jgi:hypothetical protein
LCDLGNQKPGRYLRAHLLELARDDFHAVGQF